MEPLDPQHRHILNAAQGWYELGNPTEAAAELDRLPASLLALPELLEFRWRLLSSAHRWGEALDVAEKLVQADQDNPSGWVNRSYCLHELARTNEAWESLLPAADRFPLVAVIAYNLACYACQMGRLTLALDWLRKAVRLLGRDEVRRMAAKDPDLEPLREQIREL